MILGNLERVLEMIPEDGRVLDVGGWASPLQRADYVLDLMPYATRGVGAPGALGPGPERFSAATWIQRDICHKDPYPFDDDFFDFVFCSQTLEDIRDPIWVCEEMGRVGKCGYIDVPNIIDELTWDVPEASGGKWVGHEHHRWLITLDGDELVFRLKPHSIHADPRVRIPPSWVAHLSYDERGLGHFWQGAPRAREEIIAGDHQPLDVLAEMILDYFKPSPQERDRLLRDQQALTANGAVVPRIRRLAGRLTGR